MSKKNKISKKEFNLIQPKNINNNIGYIKERMKKENIGNKSKIEIGKKANTKMGNSHNNLIYNQRPNSSRVNSNKDSKLNNIIKNNNIIDKIFSDNKKFFGFSNNSLPSSNRPISSKINIANGKSTGQFAKIMKTKKSYQ